MRWRWVGVAAVVWCATAGGAEADLTRLVSAYRPAPQGYPTGKDERGISYGAPDTLSWFRWHFYDEQAVPQFEAARMGVEVLAYNPLEGKGAAVPYLSPVKVSFVAERATAGDQSLKVDYPAAAISAGKSASAVVSVVPGPSYYPPESPYHVHHSAAAYWCHWRFLKFDAFNPLDEEVRIIVSGVPFVLKPGANVVAVKTADAAGQDGPHSAVHDAIDVTVRAPAKDLTLYLDHFRMEQEVPRVLRERGRMLAFAARADPKGEPLLWPGFTAVGRDDLYDAARGWGWTAPARTRAYYGHSFRSLEHGLLWGFCQRADAPLRIDVPKGRWGVWLWANPDRGYAWDKGAQVEINGVKHSFIGPRDAQRVRELALGGEAWDYRPGACVWEELVRRPYYLTGEVVYADAPDGRLEITVPPTLALRAIVVFPDEAKGEALAELGRLNYLWAESYDTTHGWVKGDAAERLRYIGFHEESSRPEQIPARLAALNLAPEDYTRGFVVFGRGLAEAVYPDTVPTPQELAAGAAVGGVAAPGQAECLSMGLLPLDRVNGLTVAVSGLAADGGATIPAERIDVRFARYHQKCMDYGHHNHNYNYQEHDLVKRAAVDLYPAAARRVYLDVRVPADAPAGRYTGQVTIAAPGRNVALRVPVTLEVLPIKLEEPPTLYATEASAPELARYGINAVAGEYDAAARAGFSAVMVCPYDAAPATIRGKRIGWSGMAGNKELIDQVIADGLAGRAPRVFFGGYFPGRDNKTEQPFVADLLKQFPTMEVIGHSTPAYLFAGPGYTWGWDGWDRAVRTRGKPELLTRASGRGPDFWFVDWVKNSKEQSARFTLGFWCWKLKPMGRYSTFIHNLTYFNGTAKQSYPHLPYWALSDIGGTNRYGAFSESMQAGRSNPVRDLVLVRAGIDDYRYIHTLDQLIRQAEGRKMEGEAVAQARQFRDQLSESLSLDLNTYYESRGGAEHVAYAENWVARSGNSWTTQKLDATRRQCAEHILAVRRALDGK